MSKIKLKLVPNPTFELSVPVPVPGSEPVAVVFKLKHQSRDEFKKFLNELDSMEDEAIFKKLVAGWELEDEFNDENIDKLIQNYLGVVRVVLNEYINEQGALRAAVLGK